MKNEERQIMDVYSRSIKLECDHRRVLDQLDRERVEANKLPIDKRLEVLQKLRERFLKM